MGAILEPKSDEWFGRVVAWFPPTRCPVQWSTLLMSNPVVDFTKGSMDIKGHVGRLCGPRFHESMSSYKTST